MLYSPSIHATSGNPFFLDDDKNAPSDSIEVTDVDHITAVNLPAGSTYTFSTAGVLTTTPPTTAFELAQAQTVQLGVLLQAYEQAIAADVSYTSKNAVTKTYQSDPGSVGNLQSMLLAFAAAAAAPTGFYWVASDNTQVPFVYADLQGLAQAMGAQGFVAFQQLQTLKASVNAATTVAAVQAVVWP